MKTCRTCLVEKPLDEFYRAANSPDGRRYQCKSCNVAAARQWAKDHPERYKANLRKHQQTEHYRRNRALWRERNRDKVNEQKRASAKRNRATEQAYKFAQQDDPEHQANRRAKYARWRARDPKGVHREAIWTMYRLTLDDWDDMVLAQEGRCLICDAELVRPHVDHCHATGKVRGLLCPLCNRGLGQFRDDPELLTAAINYLRAHEPERQAGS